MDINREQVLVVDDEEDLRKAIVDILTLDGFDVDQAGSAEESAEKLSQTVYDVLITDHNLPGKTGVELLEESLVRYPEIIGIIITGYGTIETAVNAMRKAPTTIWRSRSNWSSFRSWFARASKNVTCASKISTCASNWTNDTASITSSAPDGA